MAQSQMNRRFVFSSALAAIALAGFALPSTLSAQAKTAHRTPDGKPDFTGFFHWPEATNGMHGKGSATVFDRKFFAPFKPGGEAFIEPRTGDPRHDEPRDFCMPAGFPGGFLSAYPVQIFQTKDYVVLMNEFQRITRVVPMDGRPHRKGLEPTYYGDPVGHWEGETLVIDTTGFKRWNLDDYFYTDPKEFRMHSDAFHTVERLTWKDANEISYQITIDDPKIFTKPWSQDFQMTLRPDWEKQGLLEYECQENNRCTGGSCEGNK